MAQDNNKIGRMEAHSKDSMESRWTDVIEKTMHLKIWPHDLCALSGHWFRLIWNFHQQITAPILSTKDDYAVESIETIEMQMDFKYGGIRHIRRCSASAAAMKAPN